MMDVKPYFAQAEESMQATIMFLDETLAHIRAGKASARVLDPVRVEYYGSMTPLANVATISTPDAKTITIQPWEKNLLPVIEKALLKIGRAHV